MATYPNVPNAPGVPPVPRDPLAPTPPPPTYLTGDAADLGVDTDPPQWGIFDGVTPVIVADSVNALEYRKPWTIASFPVEQGGFESYDKVANPYSARVRYVTGGSLVDRQTFIQSIDAIAGGTKLYSLVTPEVTYLNANIVDYDYTRRNNDGAGMLIVDIRVEEVRQTVEAAFTNTKAPSGSGQKNDGTVQTSAPTKAQLGSIASGIQ